jgi:putative endopeptidase
MRIVNVIASISLISIVISCRNQQEDVRGVVLTHMDTTVKPTDDFFNYANGGWLKTAQIPPTEDG